MRQMRAAGIDAFGDAVRMLDLPAPSSPAPNEVVISVRAAGVGNWDEIVRVGDWDVGHRHRWRSASRRRESSTLSAKT